MASLALIALIMLLAFWSWSCQDLRASSSCPRSQLARGPALWRMALTSSRARRCWMAASSEPGTSMALGVLKRVLLDGEADRPHGRPGSDRAEAGRRCLDEDN